MSFTFYAEPGEVADTGVLIGSGYDQNADELVFIAIGDSEQILTQTQAATLVSALTEVLA